MTTMLKHCLAFALIVSACSGSTPASPEGDEGGSGGGEEEQGGSGGKKPGGTGGSGKGGSGTGGSVSTGGTPGSSGGSGPNGSGGKEIGSGGATGDGGSSAGGSGDGGSGAGGIIGDGGSSAGGSGPGAGGTNPGSSATAVVTSRYDNIRTGSTLAEKILTPANVTKDKFGLLFSRLYKGVVYGQPLYLAGVTINGAKHNVVYVATEANIVYAFDADDAAATAPLWQTMLEAPFSLTGGYPSCADMKASGQAGITSTPVIDLEQNKMFVMVKSSGAHRLHALDLTTGKDSGTTGTVMAPMFNSNQHLNRPGLLLMNGTIYAGFGSHCDDNPYKGWVFAFDSKTLAAKGVYVVTPSGIRGAIWQSGMGLYGDSSGVVFCTGNGDVGGMNLSESVVRIKQTGATLTLAEHYTPPNAAALNGADNDLTAGVTGIPGTNLIISGGKEGPIYVLDPALKILQTVRPPAAKDRDGLHSLAAWNGSEGPMVFAWPSGGRLYSWVVANATSGMLTLKSTGGMSLGHPGGTMTVSSNGTMANTGVVWANIPRLGDSWHATAQGSLFAFDAADVSKELWNSDADPKDTLGSYAKFSPPLVANGKVYQATFSGKLMVYGLK
jgi:hypothetical protein